MKRSKMMFSVCMFAMGVSAAVPRVDTEAVTAEDRSGSVVVSYKLTGAPAVVTFDVLTNVSDDVWASIGEANLGFARGDVYRLVQPTEFPKRFIWAAKKAWPNRIVEGGKVKVVVKAWPVDQPPNYMVVDLADAGQPIEYYPCAEVIPGGVTDEVYKTSKFVMRKIPAAGVVFKMGSPTTEKVYGSDGTTVLTEHNTLNEGLHDVAFTADFYMGIYPVTAGQMKKIMESDAYVGEFTEAEGYAHPDLMPYTGDRWNLWRNEMAYDDLTNRVAATGKNKCAKMYERYGLIVDLPTEAEWEFACRAGVSGPFNRPDLAIDDIMWWSGNSGDKCHEVGTKMPNFWGLYDMHGNIMEFTYDNASVKISDALAAEGLPIMVDPILAVDGDTTAAKKRRRAGYYLAAPNRCSETSPGGVSTESRASKTGVRFRAPAMAVR